MCILFMYVGINDEEGDYSLILASNRDEYYDRPTQSMEQWAEDPQVFGGRDLKPGSGSGTWLAISPTQRRIGVLLNLPGNQVDNAQSRGKIVADYVKCKTPTKDYIESMKNYTNQCNGFVLVTAELCNTISNKVYPKVSSYNNITGELIVHSKSYLGFGNCLPENPLKKVTFGINRLEDICMKFSRIEQKKQLIDGLLMLLKTETRNLPDPQLEKRHPTGYKHFSSIFVSMAEIRYGTRTHTLVLVTKTGHVDIIEISLESPIDTANPKWLTTEYQFDLIK